MPCPQRKTDLATRKHCACTEGGEDLLHALFAHMLNGVACCRMLFDDQGRPEDFVYRR